MSLTLPTYDDFVAFWGDEAVDVDEDRANLFIELSGALLFLATGLMDDPTDSNLALIVKYAICDMAVYLYVSRDDIDAEYSPFQSERIGSYSYSKTYMALSRTLAAHPGSATGVALFDRVVSFLADQAMYIGGSISSTQVFDPNYQPLWMEAWAARAFFGDPSGWGSTRAYWTSIFGTADQDTWNYYTNRAKP